MAVVVEHEKRRRQILEKALEVFVEEGFENTTMRKIAARAEITRTTLYFYFKNKKEIFNYSIKQLMADLERVILEIRGDHSLHSVDRIIRVLQAIMDGLEANRRLLAVILDYLIFLSRDGGDPNQRVRRRTVRLRHILAGMLIEGVQAGEIKNMNIRAAGELLYGFLETAIFRLTVLKRRSVTDLRPAMESAVKMMRA